MKKHVVTEAMLSDYRAHLLREERSRGTIQKYEHDIKAFYAWLPTSTRSNGGAGGGASRSVDKETVIAYKSYLVEHFAVSTVNSTLAALNGFFSFYGFHELHVKPLKKQRALFCSKEKELTKEEYLRLLSSAQQNGNRRLYLIMQTICATGIRVSELQFIRAESVQSGVAQVNCKGKRRSVFLPQKLCNLLSAYLKETGVKSGSVFVTKSGAAINRSNIWSEMKRLCASAGVNPQKVFPHNLRHLFARTFYSLEKDIAKLADILGHSNIDTTRIYIMESGAEHERQMARLGLIL